MANGKGLSGFFAGLRKKPKPSQVLSNSAVEEKPALTKSTTVEVGRNYFSFGLEWQLFSDRKELSTLLRNSQEKGYSHYVVSSSEDMVGLVAGIGSKESKKAMSAAIHLAETSSLGGLEVFIFELPNRLYSLTALNDSQPVQYFDQVGSQEEVLGLVAEYRALQSDQPIRYVGNVEFFENIEQLALNDAFKRPDNRASLTPLPNYRLRKLLALVLVPSVLAFAAGAAWFQHMQQVEEQERIAREQDPNYIYENAVGPAMQQTGLQAQITLERWRELIFRIPTARVGWKLDKITCQPTACTVSWKRDFGSYQDFHATPLDGTTSSTEAQNGDSPANAGITTVLTVPSQPAEAMGLKRADLPGLRQTLQQVASQLQDISLLKDVEVKLKKPELYPATGASIEQINNPVAKGEWTITHELWTLSDLSFDLPNLVLQNLTITQNEKTKDWTYTLTGNYYARGKSN